MTQESTIITQKKDKYAIITINRPKALNALNTDVLEGLYESISQITTDKNMRAVIITGKDKAFVAGADIAAMKDLTPEQAEEFAQMGHKTMNAISQSEIISVAAINGFALGGGLELALACDMRLGCENAKMGLPEVSLGLFPGFGGTQRLPRVVGKGIALEMILGGGMIDAKRAYEIGLLNAVHPQEDLLNEAENFIQKMIKNTSFLAQKSARWVLNSGLDTPLPAGLAKEITSFAELFSTNDPKKGMTAFLNKEKIEF